MTAFMAWAEATLCASTALMLLILSVRTPVRPWAGPRLSYALWALPAVRTILPSLPAGVLMELPLAGQVATGMSVLFMGSSAASGLSGELQWSSIRGMLLLVWLAGAISLFAIYAVRHFVFCRRLRAKGTDFGRVGGIYVISADVEGPLAFGVFRRSIAVPREFVRDYAARERELVLAHERAHHVRGDLIANWASLVVLAVHWWNPVAWFAVRAFRDDQEFAADAHVLSDKEPGALALYAQVLAKASGIGALPVCNLDARSNLKGRLMMLSQKPRSGRRLVFGAAALTLFGSAALAATVVTPGASGFAGKQVVTIGVKPDGSGSYALIISDTAVTPHAPLPGGVTLPADFTGPGGCDLKPTAKPYAMVIKGFGKTQTYTVMCAAPHPRRFARRSPRDSPA